MRRTVFCVALIGAAVLVTGKARADSIYWIFNATCAADSDQTQLTVRCNDYVDCVGRSTTLYGCGGDCGGPDLVAEGITWGNVEEECTCYPSGSTPPCTPPEVEDCWTDATATLPVGCDELGYEMLCAVSQCPAPDQMIRTGTSDCGGLRLPPELSGTKLGCAGDDGPGGSGSGGGSGGSGGESGGASGGASADADEDDGEASCSISTSAANVSLFSVLLLALGSSLVAGRLCRQRRRRP